MNVGEVIDLLQSHLESGAIERSTPLVVRTREGKSISVNYSVDSIGEGVVLSDYSYDSEDERDALRIGAMVGVSVLYIPLGRSEPPTVHPTEVSA